jgi:hypothetical protein
MISTEFRAGIVVQLRAQITFAFGAAFGQQIHVVPITSRRGVSDPLTDPGVRVRGPEVGSLTPRLLACADHPRGKRRRAIIFRTDPTAVGKLNVLQEKRSRVRRGGRRGRRFQFDESVSMLKG